MVKENYQKTEKYFNIRVILECNFATESDGAVSRYGSCR